MDPNLLKNLNLNSSINQNDIQLLNQILGSIGSCGKAPKMTAKERNDLINKLSSNKTLNEVPKKELKDMNEKEKQIYRDELKQKLKNKQNEKKMLRTSNLVKKNTLHSNSNYSDAIGKINEMMKNIDPATLNELSSEPNDKTNIPVNVQSQNSSNSSNIKQEFIINNVINKTNNEDIINNDYIGPDGKLDDYLN